MIRLLSVPALMLPLAAGAQEAGDPVDPDADRWFDAHDLFLAAFDGDLRDPLRLNRPGRLRPWDWFAGGVLEYANAPLRRYDEVGGDTVVTSLLDHVVALNLAVGVALHERLRLDVTAPLYFASFDANDDWQGVDFGDLRVRAMVPLVLPDEHDEGVGLGLTGHVDVPTGSRLDFLGNRTVAGGGSLAFSYAATFGLTATAEAGVHFRDRVDLGNIDGSDRFFGGVALGYLVSRTTSLNLETNLTAAFDRSEGDGEGADEDQDQVPSFTESPMEVTFTVRHRRPSGAHLLVGAAGGISRGAGAARARVFLGGGFGRTISPRPQDPDGDGLVGRNDLCPEEPETFNGHLDTDGCPDELASIAARATLDGRALDGAKLTFTPSDGAATQAISGLEPFVHGDLIPGSEVTVAASLGPCLVGERTVVVEPGRQKVDVPLEPWRPARVVYELVGMDGAPVRDAVSTWQTESPGCADREGYVLASEGPVEHPVGPGAHTVFVDVPGYRIYREDVTIHGDETYVIRAELKPTRIQIERQEIMILEKVYFETGSARILPSSFELLDEVADTIIANDVGRVLVEGHTDSVGGDAFNLRLSQARARAVLEYLGGKGVPASQLVSEGYGEERPVASNATEAGRAKNRRVIFTLVDQDPPNIDVEEAP